MIHSITFRTYLLVACLVELSLVNSHWRDLCVIGRDGVNDDINGNYTYMGHDPDNQDREYWYHTTKDIAIEWAYKYFGSSIYVFKRKDVAAYYGYCSIGTSAAIDCTGHWYVWGGSSWELEFYLHVERCFWYWEDHPNCNNESYIDFLGIDHTNAYCIDGATVNSDINGNYEWVGCDDGLPYYELVNYNGGSGNDNYYLHFDWTEADWLISDDITSTIDDTTSTIAYCDSWDFIDCDFDLYENDGAGSYTIDTDTNLELCTPAPSEAPTAFPTAPTNNPTDSPTHKPTDSPSNIPTKAPSNNPTYGPSDIPSSSPTNNPSEDPTPSPTDTPTQNPTDRPTTSPSGEPTDKPTQAPTHKPTISPSADPTSSPTGEPTNKPTNSPSGVPTDRPTGSPTDKPTLPPTHALTTTTTASKVTTRAVSTATDATTTTMIPPVTTASSDHDTTRTATTTNILVVSTTETGGRDTTKTETTSDQISTTAESETTIASGSDSNDETTSASATTSVIVTDDNGGSSGGSGNSGASTLTDSLFGSGNDIVGYVIVGSCAVLLCVTLIVLCAICQARKVSQAPRDEHEIDADIEIDDIDVGTTDIDGDGDGDHDVQMSTNPIGPEGNIPTMSRNPMHGKRFSLLFGQVKKAGKRLSNININSNHHNHNANMNINAYALRMMSMSASDTGNGGDIDGNEQEGGIDITNNHNEGDMYDPNNTTANNGVHLGDFGANININETDEYEIDHEESAEI